MIMPPSSGPLRKEADLAWGKKPICHVMIHRV
jgi:hypothetical protein